MAAKMKAMEQENARLRRPVSVPRLTWRSFRKSAAGWRPISLQQSSR